MLPEQLGLHRYAVQGCTRGGVWGSTPPLSLVFYYDFIACTKGITCFLAYFLLVKLST